jgi:hypothetical protein
VSAADTVGEFAGLPLTLRIRALRERPDGQSGPNFWINTCISSRAAHPVDEVNEFASSIKIQVTRIDARFTGLSSSNT